MVRHHVVRWRQSYKHHKGCESINGYVEVQTEHCINHVQKHMGTSAHDLLQKHRGESGRLAADLADKLALYYKRALKSRIGDADAMQQAVRATSRPLMTAAVTLSVRQASSLGAPQAPQELKGSRSLSTSVQPAK